MSQSETFRIGYLKTLASLHEDLFLSITPNFVRGPGIQRDGVTTPRMTDPHTVNFVMHNHGSPERIQDFPPTDNAYVQRAGTWTLFQHVKHFIDTHGRDYQIMGVQSCGDLTMNPWHVALVETARRKTKFLCRLATQGDPPDIQEPVHDRRYRCLVKWTNIRGLPKYNFIDLKFYDMATNGFFAEIVDEIYLDKNGVLLKRHGIDPSNIAPNIEFALAGKPIIQRGRDMALENVIDHFQDVRHVFNVPMVPASGAMGLLRVTMINFGEFTLYKDLNARRGALNSPIIIPLIDPVLNVTVTWDTLKAALDIKHFRQSPESPTRRGEYRKYSDKLVEIFYPHNVYPFGVLGGKPDELVCLSSGGLSGRVGSTLEGITRIMYDFFGCEEAMVLDEGFDTFHIVNPRTSADGQLPQTYKYNNQQVLDGVAAFTLWQAQEDTRDCRTISKDYPMGPDMTKWKLNAPLFSELGQYAKDHNIQPTRFSNLDIMAVEPHRSQIRAVIVFAVRIPK